MNNSKLASDSVSLHLDVEPNRKEFYTEQETKLVRKIEALRFIRQTKEWSSLKEEVLDGLVKSLEGQISQEAKKENPNISRLNRLTGELKWAERYSDLQKLEESFRVELQNIRLKLHGQT